MWEFPWPIQGNFVHLQKKGDNSMNKKFTSKFFLDTFYEVIDEFWLGKNTYVIVFQDMIDADGDTFHLEVEYHKDEERITYTRVYKFENVEASQFVSPCFKKQIEEYTLQQVGVLHKGSFLSTQNLSLELELGIPEGTTIGELNEWLTTLKFEIVHTMTPRDEKIKLLSVKSKGIKK